MPTLFRRGEFHAFDGDGAPYLYLVPSAAVFRLDEASVAVLDTLGDRDVAPGELAQSLSDRFPLPEVKSAIEELVRIRAVKAFDAPLNPPPVAAAPVAPAIPPVTAPRKLLYLRS